VAWSLHWIERSFVGRFFRLPALRFGLLALVPLSLSRPLSQQSDFFLLLICALLTLMPGIDNCEGSRFKLPSPPWRPMHQQLRPQLTATRGDL
jgi:hypothetical protein